MATLSVEAMISKLSGMASPDTKYVKVGIIEPDGKRRYISAKGDFAHTFKLTKNGSYRVYAENKNGSAVNVAGAYQVVD